MVADVSFRENPDGVSAKNGYSLWHIVVLPSTGGSKNRFIMEVSRGAKNANVELCILPSE